MKKTRITRKTTFKTETIETKIEEIEVSIDQDVRKLGEKKTFKEVLLKVFEGVKVLFSFLGTISKWAIVLMKFFLCQNTVLYLVSLMEHLKNSYIMQ